MAHRVRAILLEASLGGATHWTDEWILKQMYLDQFNLEISGDQVAHGIHLVVKMWFIFFFFLVCLIFH